MSKCNQTDCDKPVLSRGMCSRHYNRWWRHGDPLVKYRQGTVPPVLDSEYRKKAR